MKKFNKKGYIAIFALLLLVFVGATYAWFSENINLVNAFRTGTYETEITENFIAPKDWRPGMEVPKEVEVKNKGDVPVVVRVKFSDAWYEKGGTIRGDLNVFTYESVKEGKRAAEAAIKNLDEANCIANPSSIAAGDKWFVRYEKILVDGVEVTIPREAYYLQKLSKNEKTKRILKSVTMNENIVAERTREVTDVVEDGGVIGKKVVSATRTPYAGTRYELTVTVETVQADKGAVLEVWNDAFGEHGTLEKETAQKLLKSLKLL